MTNGKRDKWKREGRNPKSLKRVARTKERDSWLATIQECRVTDEQDSLCGTSLEEWLGDDSGSDISGVDEASEESFEFIESPCDFETVSTFLSQGWVLPFAEAVGEQVCRLDLTAAEASGNGDWHMIDGAAYVLASPRSSYGNQSRGPSVSTSGVLGVRVKPLFPRFSGAPNRKRTQVEKQRAALSGGCHHFVGISHAEIVRRALRSQEIYEETFHWKVKRKLETCRKINNDWTKYCYQEGVRLSWKQTIKKRLEDGVPSRVMLSKRDRPSSGLVHLARRAVRRRLRKKSPQFALPRSGELVILYLSCPRGDRRTPTRGLSNGKKVDRQTKAKACQCTERIPKGSIWLSCSGVTPNLVNPSWRIR